MNIFFGILIAIGCMFSFFAYIPFSSFIYTWNSSYNSKSKIDRVLKKLKIKTIDNYDKLIEHKNYYTIYSIILLNIVCFISQFFSISHDLKTVILIINGLFLMGVLFSINTNKLLKNYISLLQDLVATKVALKNYFKIEKIDSMPVDYKCYGEFMRIKDKLYFNKNDINLVFKIRNKYYKKVRDSELDYIVDQLNNLNENLNANTKIKSLHKVPQLNYYSNFISNENFTKKPTPKSLAIFSKCYRPISVIISVIYYFLVALSIAACCGTDWFYWFPI